MKITLVENFFRLNFFATKVVFSEVDFRRKISVSIRVVPPMLIVMTPSSWLLTTTTPFARALAAFTTLSSNLHLPRYKIANLSITLAPKSSSLHPWILSFDVPPSSTPPTRLTYPVVTFWGRTEPRANCPCSFSAFQSESSE